MRGLELTILNLYLLGVFGSMMVEISQAVTTAGFYGGKAPPQYRQPFFVLMRIMLALAAGVIPVVLEANTAYNAIVLGASAPLFFDKAARGLSEPVFADTGRTNAPTANKSPH
jgi:hypothetical protein